MRELTSDLGFILYGQLGEFMLRPVQFSTGDISVGECCLRHGRLAAGGFEVRSILGYFRLDHLGPGNGLCRRSDDFASELAGLANGVPQVWVWSAPRTAGLPPVTWFTDALPAHTPTVSRRDPQAARHGSWNFTSVLAHGTYDDHQPTDRLGRNLPYLQQSAYDESRFILACEIERSRTPIRSYDSCPKRPTPLSARGIFRRIDLLVKGSVAPFSQSETWPRSRLIDCYVGVGFSLAGEQPYFRDEEIRADAI